MDTMNTIPGADALGYGFNILGEYDTSSLTSQLFIHKNMDDHQFTFPPTDISYKVPDNTSVIQYTKTSGGTYVFSTREQFQNHFSVKAGVSGSYGGFSGEFNMAYENTLNTDREYYFGLHSAEYTGWKLLLENQSPEWLSQDFTDDPNVQNLPPTFTRVNQDLFFDVFRRFGTHYVSQVTAGGSMDYFVEVEKTHSYSEQQISADITLEYKAVFMSAKAEAETEWKQLGEKWAESRKVKVDALGGDNSVLNALDPGYGDSDSNIFKSWADAVMKNPAVVNYELRPISLLFPADVANAVDQALEAYTNGAILANANADYTPNRGPGGGDFTTSSSIIINGNVIIPNPHVPVPPPYIWHNEGSPSKAYPIGGFQVALFDAKTLKTIMSHKYYIKYTSRGTTQSEIYQEMLKDINAIPQSAQYLCAVSGFAIGLHNYPTPDFGNWLASCGASLSVWKEHLSMTGTPMMISYAFIGKRGLMPGNGTESFAMNTRWWDYPWIDGSTDASALAMLYTHELFSDVIEKKGSPQDLEASLG